MKDMCFDIRNESIWPLLQKENHEIKRLNFVKQKILQNCENLNFEFEMFLVLSHDPVKLQ